MTQTVPGNRRAAAAADSPYVGLTHYTEEHAPLFFGREAERKRIIGNLRASRLTLLYAESGVGKSSLLRAGVAARVREAAEGRLSGRSSGRYVPVVFSSWGKAPVEGLVAAIGEAVRPFAADGAPALPNAGLEQAVAAATAAVGGTLLVILDQFEEYFLYRSREARGSTFADELARCVNRSDLRANFLLAIREDAYAGLGELFKGRIANVYGNYLHLEYLDRDAAREAIVKPLAFFNALHEGEQPVEIDPELVEAVLDQVTRGRIVIGEGGRGAIDPGEGGEVAIETPYLQLVMRRLWDEERAAGSRRLRRETLDSIGGAATIISTHLDQAMSGLSPEQQNLAAAVFRYLVTPSGSKIALSLPDLAQLAEVPVDGLAQVVERLAAGDVRILRPVASADHGASQYEIFHDALSRPILDWRTRYVREQREREAAEQLEDERAQREQAQREAAEAEERAERARRRARVLRLGLAMSVLAILAAIGTFVYIQRRDADREAARAHSVAIADRADEASANPAIGPVAAELASLEAYRLSPTFEALRGTLGGLQRSPGMPTILVGTRRVVFSVAFSPDSRLVASGGADGLVRVWERSGRQLAALHTPSLQRVKSVAFGRGGRLIAAARGGGILDIWTGGGGDWRLADELSFPAGGGGPGSGADLNAVALSPNGRLLAAGGDDGQIRLWDVSDPARPVELAGPPHLATLAIEGLAFDPTGTVLASADSGGLVDLWALATTAAASLTAKPLSVSENGATATAWCVAFSADGSLLAAGSSTGSVFLWNVTNRASPTLLSTADGVPTIAGDARPADGVYAVAFARGSSVLVTGSADDNVVTWDLGDPARPRPFGPPRSFGGDVHGVAASPDGTTIAAGSFTDDLVELWPLDGRGALARTIGYSDGSDNIRDVAIGPGGLVAAAGRTSGVTLWSARGDAPPLRAAEPVGAIATGYSQAVAFDGSLLAAATLDPASQRSSFALWDTGPRCRTAPRTPCRLGGATAPQDSAWINGLAFIDGGRAIASADGYGNVRLWDVSEASHIGAPVTLVQGRPGDTSQAVDDVDYNPARHLLAVADEAGFARVWNVRDARHPVVVATLRPTGGGAVYAVALSADGRLLAQGGQDQAVTLWNVADLHHPKPLGLLAQTNSITALAFSPDGAVVASGDADANIVLWDVATARRLGELAGRHAFAVNRSAIDALAFDPQGRYLLSAGRSNPIVAWDPILWRSHPDGAMLREEACRLAGRNLTEVEWSTLFSGTSLARHRRRTCPEYPLP